MYHLPSLQLCFRPLNPANIPRGSLQRTEGKRQDLAHGGEMKAVIAM